MSQPEELSDEQFRQLYAQVSTWGRWGSADRRGALNYITPGRLRAASAEVRTGLAVSMSQPVDLVASADNPHPPLHHMTVLPDVPVDSGTLRFAMDYVGMNLHGDAQSHIDALCHVIYDGMLWNGVPGETLTSAGAAELSIDVAHNGIVGRGVMLDIPRLQGRAWLEPGEQVLAADLLAAEESQHVRVQSGDLLFVRVGHRRRRDELGPWDVANARAGLHPSAMEFVAEREVAALGSDSNNDAGPSAVPGVAFPIHVLAVNAMGMHLLDFLQLEGLARECELRDSWSFLCAIAPLRLAEATGSPINPIAIL
jgi:kynurenine formamidase